MKPVRCVHPAWVTHVPPGSRRQRDTLVRMMTPVELRPWTGGVFRSGFEASRNRVFDHGREIILSGFDRSYWQRLHASDGSPIGTDDLIDYLEGRPIIETKALGLGHCFAGTPVAAFAGVGTWYWQDRRGDEPKPRGLGEVRGGHPDAASADLVGFLDANVALHETGVMMRTRPVAVSTGNGETDGWKLCTRRRLHEWRALAASSSNYHGLRDARRSADFDNMGSLSRWSENGRHRPDPDADLAYMLNVHASPVLGQLAGSIPRWAHDDGAHATLVARYEELRPIARRADLGLAGSVDLALEVEILCAAVECAVAFPGARGPNRAGVESLAATVRELVAPRIRTMLSDRVTREDVEALGTLGPM